MQKVIDDLRKFSEPEPDSIPDFTETAVEWSAYCIRNLRGDLLTLGLDIAKALSEFDRGLKHPETLDV